MQTFKQKIFFTSLTFLIAFGALVFFYGEVLFHPNDYLFAPNGDGIKNYYAYIFHARYDESFWNFGGMNYPFYEHMVYTDGHPILSWLIGKLGLTNYAIGILNFLMLISFPICAVFLHRILAHYRVQTVWAIAAAIAIAFMSPQVFRMTGHLSLAYVFAIPAMWYFLIKVLNTKQKRWLIMSSMYLLIFFFTHPYLGMILVFFCLFFWLVFWFWNRAQWRSVLLPVFFQVVLPVLVFQLLVMLTDTHENRVGQPAGFFDYYASWKSVFVPHSGVLNHLTHILKIDVGNWESWNYVGISTTVFAWTILIYLIRNRRTIEFKNLAKSELGMFMLAAHLVLLFAFCFPLKYDFLRGIVDFLGPLKQFRVLGRFGWIFFYVFTVFCTVGFYRIYLRSQRKVVLGIIYAAGILFYGIELYPVHRVVSESVSASANLFQRAELSKDQKEIIEFTEAGAYDAIMVLPFQHMSSENIAVMGAEDANLNSFLFSYHTGLPMLNSITSRMSLSEAILFNNFFSPEFIEKELIYQMPDSAKILIIKTLDGVDADERRLLYCSQKVLENSSFKAYEFLPEKWNTTYYFDQVMEADKIATVSLQDGWRSSTDSVWFHYESFDNDPGESLGGEGALHGTKKGYDLMYTLNTANLDTGKYVLSFWYYLLVDRPDVLAVAEVDSVGDRKAFWFDQMEVSQSTFIVDNWCFVELEFEVSPQIEAMNLLLTGNGNGQPFYLDELLIRKMQQAPIFRSEKIGDEEYVIYNNYWIRKNSFQR